MYFWGLHGGHRSHFHFRRLPAAVWREGHPVSGQNHGPGGAHISATPQKTFSAKSWPTTTRPKKSEISPTSGTSLHPRTEDAHGNVGDGPVDRGAPFAKSTSRRLNAMTVALADRWPCHPCGGRRIVGPKCLCPCAESQCLPPSCGLDHCGHGHLCALSFLRPCKPHGPEMAPLPLETCWDQTSPTSGLALGLTALVAVRWRSTWQRIETCALVGHDRRHCGIHAVCAGLETLTRTEGLLFLAGRTRCTWGAKSSPQAAPKSEEDPFVAELLEETGDASRSYPLLLGLMVLGMCGAVLWIGSLCVWGQRMCAFDLGISTHVVGVTVVAFGTSVPEIAASLTAAHQAATVH